MAKYNRTANRKFKLDDSIGICSVDVHGVFDHKSSIPRTESHDVIIDSHVRIGWEYDTDHGVEFLEAVFSPAQLFQAASGMGLLTTTTSGKAKVPRGLGATKRFLAVA